MEYKFQDIEKKWQQWWKENNIYKVSNDSPKPKSYVLDMFPYPSGAGLHVGHPLGYIASDIYARYKRLKGYNVLHPMGYDAFGLPAEQYAIDHGIHPAVSTGNNINNFRKQLDNIGFCFDWSREVRTCDPKYYKWTQWIFLQLFHSFYNRKTDRAGKIEGLIKAFEKEGNRSHPMPNSQFPFTAFAAADWRRFDEKMQQDVLMQYRLAYCGYGEVNWCEALGTVLANDEVINGVSERGGYPVVKKKLRQWYLRITEYADRLLEGLQKVDFSESMKEMQSNWIGKSSGAEIDFRIHKPPLTPPKGENTTPRYQTALPELYNITKKLAEEKRERPTPEEEIIWQLVRANKTGFHIRRQHIIGFYIVDFACLDKLATIEIDGGYHNDPVIQHYDKERTRFLNENGFTEIRFTNEEVRKNANAVIKKLTEGLSKLPSVPKKSESSKVSPSGGDLEGALKLRVYTTRPDTIFGVDFMVIAPEHELVEQITTEQQRQAVEDYITHVKSRSERERMAEKKITGVFTGSYAINPFNERAIPIWISEYVLIGYGTGAIMAVPCGDQRDFLFAKHFNIPITNIIGKDFTGEEANPTKDAILENSDFINGMVMKDAIELVIKRIEELGIGKRKVNYKMRDAAFSRQRYWGEPFPIIWKNDIAYPLDESELPLELPHVETYKSGPEGEGPLANLQEWYLIPDPSPQAEKGNLNPRLSSHAEKGNLIPDPSPQAEKGKVGAANVPKYSVHTPTQYEFARTMRKEHTEAEKQMWELLRNNQLGVKFRRQHPIEVYIVDFISLQNKLIVEIDGDYHENEEQKQYDEMRTNTLKQIGFNVIRFSNEEVLKNPYKVRDKIKVELAAQINSPLMGDKIELDALIPSPLVERGQGVRETNTMPGYAGSSWYFLRYMDPHNDKEFCNKKVSDYWNQVDLYIGGTEHAVGHLLYSRMWTKFLFDRGWIEYDEPYKKLVNQGMIQGSSRFVYRVAIERIENADTSLGIAFNQIGSPLFISYNFVSDFEKMRFDEQLNFIKTNAQDWEGLNTLESDRGFLTLSYNKLHVDVNIVDGNVLNIEAFKKSKPEYMNAKFILYNTLGHVIDGKGERLYLCGSEIEKMSKRYYNVVNPNDIVDKYGADTFRMYEMFLGPVEQSKPWETKGIEGVFRFLKKFWRLFVDEEKGLIVTDAQPTNEELKVLHKAIKKIAEDTERFSFNTGVSGFMIATNELTDLKCHKRSILEPLVILLAPYAPHISEELWHLLGHTTSVFDAHYPTFEEKYVKESSKTYPVAINGKTRTELTIALDATQQQVEEIVLANEIVKKWMEGRPPKKVIYVKNKMVNVVV